MRFVLIALIFFLFQNCTKPKTVVICGDHVCVNKAEAEQYFEENLSIEVKIIDSKIKNNIDLVELNLKKDLDDKKQVTIKQKKGTNEKVKILTNKEIEKIKENIKKKEKNKKVVQKISNKKINKVKKNKKIVKKIVKKNTENIDKISDKSKKVSRKDAEILVRINDNKQRKDVVDVCTIIEKCSIDAISKYLIELGKNKDFPDITSRE